MLLLDEPASHLDVGHQLKLFRVLDGVRRCGVGVLAVVHDLSRAAGWAERMVLMAEGRVAAEGTPAAVLGSDACPAPSASGSAATTWCGAGATPLQLRRRRWLAARDRRVAVRLEPERVLEVVGGRLAFWIARAPAPGMVVVRVGVHALDRVGLCWCRIVSPMATRRAAALAGAGFILRLAIAPSYGYGGVDGDLIEHKQMVHVALERGFHEIYRANAANDPALTGRDWQGGYFVNQPPVIHYLRVPIGWVYRLVSPRGYALWPPELNYLEAERTDLRARLTASRGFTVAWTARASWRTSCSRWDSTASPRPAPGSGLGCSWPARTRSIRESSTTPRTGGSTTRWRRPWFCWAFTSSSMGSSKTGWAVSDAGGLAEAAGECLLASAGRIGLSRFPRAGCSWRVSQPRASCCWSFPPFIFGGTLGITLDALARSTFGGEPFVSCNASNLWWLIGGEHGSRSPTRRRFWDL